MQLSYQGVFWIATFWEGKQKERKIVEFTALMYERDWGDQHQKKKMQLVTISMCDLVPSHSSLGVYALLLVINTCAYSLSNSSYPAIFLVVTPTSIAFLLHGNSDFRCSGTCYEWLNRIVLSEVSHKSGGISLGDIQMLGHRDLVLLQIFCHTLRPLHRAGGYNTRSTEDLHPSGAAT